MILAGVTAVCLIARAGEYWIIALMSVANAVTLTVVTVALQRVAVERETNLEEAATANAELQRANTTLTTLREAAERDAVRDDLTQLCNRRGLARELTRLSEASEPDQTDLAVFHIDLDRFKEINDTRGHAVGDEVLRRAAEILSSEAQGDFIARVGGDEFLLIAANVAGKADAEERAQRLIERLRRPIMVKGESCLIGASIGVEMIARSARMSLGDFQAAVVNADIALYSAKEAGRDCARFYTADLRSAAREHKQLSDELHRALEEGQFEPAYQPQFSAADGTLTGVEALARWRHPTRGVLSPAVFLPVAERIGATHLIDAAILERALADLKHWDSIGLHVPRLAVNISAGRLRDPRLIEGLEELELPVGRLSFEILESVFTDTLDDTTEPVLRWLDAHGVDLELDDFGLGHTSLLALLNLSPKRLKIARELAGRAATSERHRHMTEAITGVAHSLGVSVVAEGVETAEDVEVLRQAKCDVLQGFFFARPMAHGEFIAAYAPQARASA